MKIRSKSGYTRFSASLLSEAIAKNEKPESTKTIVSRMREKQKHPLTFSRFKKVNMLF